MPSLTGLLLSPRQRRSAFAGFAWWRRAVAPALWRAVAPTLLRGVLHVQAQSCAHHQGAVCIPAPFEGGRQRSAQGASKQARVLALLCGPSGATIATVTHST